MQPVVFSAILVVMWVQGVAEGSGHAKMPVFDTDGDGQASVDEVLHVLVDRPVDDENEADADVEETEHDARRKAHLRERAIGLFKKVDDGDGSLSEDEIAILFEKMAEENEHTEM
eukprot:TRINITY_DN53644_c0_g1_i1.p3 TRINITY_DN53644_c0_g1~~TRINITY_DN53644_c0_g1_i1.p3  ORF type:complete len:115 (-),score=29.36 TRINITY_DN53644_c0_g1_i1:50-394(-)